MNPRHLSFALIFSLLLSCTGPKDGVHTLKVLSTNDVHGAWFDSSYTGGMVRNSLMAINPIITGIREADGADNVLLLDAGDCLQGDNATYYYNYIDTLSPHLYPRLVKYMGYDAIVAGNHDFEAGHAVYDRVAADIRREGIAYLAGNAIRASDGMPYFPKYAIFRRAGLKIAVLGYTNPNIPGWVPQSRWEGVKFESLVPLVQTDVDMVRRKEKPDVTIVAIHSGYGRGDGRELENQGQDLLESLQGVDLLVNSHDHHSRTEEFDGLHLMNSGSHAREVACATIKVTVEKGRVTSKEVETSLIPVRAEDADPEMRAAFREEFEAVRDFTTKKIGSMDCDMITSDAFKGMCPYINLLHTLSISCSPANISFAAPLTINAKIPRGPLCYNDLFTIYPYENQLFVLRMTGKEVRNFLEYSYHEWIQTWNGEHILNISPSHDKRYSMTDWSFNERFYNFDSAAGINYTVDITKPYGERVAISTMTGGEPFDLEKTYFVAMTSYRASGGGGHITLGAGIENPEERIVERYPEIRDILFQYILETGGIEEAVISDPARIGHWEFIPDPLAHKALEEDMKLLF